MSQRTILEINHDMARVDPGDIASFMRLWNIAIGSGSEENWARLQHQWGVRRITQCHHSEDRKAVIGSGALVREYPIG